MISIDLDLTADLAVSPVLLIDDNAANLTLLQRTLEWGGFTNLHLCTQGREGLDLIADLNPHLVILDLMMPGMSGYEFLESMGRKQSSKGLLPILVYTADLTAQAKIRALELGAADFLTKPGEAVEICLRVRNFLRTRLMQLELHRSNEVLESRVQRRTEHLATARKEAILLLGKASEYRDDETGHHSQRVGDMSAAIAAQIGLDEEMVESIRLVAPLHDIGKIAIPDQILHKPGKLTDDEYEDMKLHVKIGADLLARCVSPMLQLAQEIALYHHERWDGKGYIRGLAGEDIPISARIVAVADTFDAITHDRPYREARSEAVALEILAGVSGSQFDPLVVDAIHKVMA